MRSEPAGRILVVDDTEANRYTLAHYLKPAGFEVWEAATGREGLELAKKCPDLMVLDIKLPDMLGYDISHIIKGNPATSSISILQISATYVNPESRVHSLDSGADAYLTWPFSADELLANVNALMRLAKAERNAKEKAAQLRFVLSTIADSYFSLDTQLRFVEVNRVARETIFNRSEEELIGSVYSQLFPQTQFSDLQREVSRALGEKHPVHTEVRSTINARWYEAHIYPRGELLEIYLRDISERKKAEQAMQFQLDLVRTITDNTSSGLWMTDSEGRCTFANPASEVISGFKADEVIGKAFDQIVHRPAPGIVLPAGYPIERALRSNEVVQAQEEMFLHKDGHLYPVRYSTRPIVKEGHPIGTLIEVQDISDEREAGEALARAQAELENHARNLEEAVAQRTSELLESNKELEAFSYSVSHDLRAPLRAISGYSGILMKQAWERLNGEERRFLQSIIASAAQMGRLVDGLLNFSRLGRKELDQVTVNMRTLFERGIADLPAGGPTVEAKVDPALPPSLGDPTLLRQVAANLLDNAYKFSSKKEKVEIEIGFSGFDPERSLNSYFVSDKGAGFDMRYVDKLFGVFQRLHATEEFEGTGIGLAFTKRIIERHGGHIWGEGKVGEGATFHFTLPAAILPGRSR